MKTMSKGHGTGVVASGLDFAQLLPDMRALFQHEQGRPLQDPMPNVFSKGHAAARETSQLVPVATLPKHM